MGSREEFIKITDLNSSSSKTNNVETNDDSIDIYQVQAIDNKSNVSIVKIGSMTNPHDVLIKKFTLYDKYDCYIISKLYSIEQINELFVNKIFPMVRLNICINNNNVIGYLTFNFCSKSETTNTQVEGTFSITFHYNTKYIILETLNTFCGVDTMMLKLTEHLLSDTIQNSIQK